MKPRLWWLAPLLLLASAQAQTPRGVRVLVYGARKIGDCAAPIRALQAELPTLPFPDGWTIGVVCNAVAWDQILHIADPPPTDTAFSNLIKRSTVVNAAIFRQSRAQYHHTLAHELGHAECNCASEWKAERFALQQEALERKKVLAKMP